MNKYLQNTILFPVILCITFSSCESNNVKSSLAENPASKNTESPLNQEENELKSKVEQLLFAVGNSNWQALDSMISNKANLGIAIVRDGVSKNSVITIGEYFETQKNRDRERKPFYEPVKEYKILINKNQIAFVWADATLHKYGVPKSNNIDNFTLIKEDGEWKFINISFTNTQLPEELKKFDPEIFARSYAQVWCSQRPNFVSSFFAEDGELTVNDAEPAIGTEAISNVAKGFMDAFPDMVVTMDSLVNTDNKLEFYWTLTGTNTGANGIGNKVKISGFEEWTLNENGLIQKSKGHFDANEYEQQLKNGYNK